MLRVASKIREQFQTEALPIPIKEGFMKYSLVLMPLLIVIGCSLTTKVTTPGRALIGNKTVEDVFGLVAQAVAESEFRVLLVNEKTGFISAVRTGGLVTGEVAITCKVGKTADGDVSVNVTSTLSEQIIKYGLTKTPLSEQIVAYGLTKSSIEILFKRLAVYLPDAELTIDGKPFDPTQ